MSNLKVQLTDDMKTAMKARDSLKLNTIRFLLSAIKNWEIDNGEQDDEGVMKVIAKELKKIKDALPDFEKAGRQDLIEEEMAKVKVMESYLPQQMSDEELTKIAQEVLESSDKKDFGSIMKGVMARVQGQADGGRVSAVVKTVTGG